ncbi:BPSS1780 family membrane protein [Stenotrophomonas sp.]|uniref:BPSS1780 family membrane protein n=1 Tax=Stenotrophomonas sp. TaxID=69392 RepID=UPI00289F1E26|nr:BPSS1780 family membrane protein [Stenotrophomonas sp.]
MRDIRKLPASAGAQWLLDTFSLYRRAPLQLAVLGIIGMLVSSLMFALAQALPSWIGIVVQMLWLASGPIVFGGMLWAVREIDEGRRALPGHLLQPMLNHRVSHLVLPFAIQLFALAALFALLVLLIGRDGLKVASEAFIKSQELQLAGAAPNSEAVLALWDPVPVKRILLWFGLVIATVFALSMAMFTQPALVMLDRQNGIHALRMSLQGCIENFGAMTVFMLLGLVASTCISFLTVIVMQVGLLIGGPAAASAIQLLVMTTVMMPLYVGAVYAAWKQMFAHRAGSTPPPVPPSNGPKKIFAA